MRRVPALVRAHLLTATIVTAAYVIGYLSTIKYKPMFAPDSRYYAGMSLHYGGMDKEAAAREVAEYSAKSGWPGVDTDTLFGWGLVQPRVVFPALATPFVKIFGIPGLAVVSGLAMALFVLTMTVMLTRRWGSVAAIGTVLLICTSPQLLFYGSAMLTESLTALWGALLLALAWRYIERPSHRLVLGMVALTVVAGFTRQSTLIPAGAFVVAWLGAAVARRRPNPWRVPALAVAATSIAVQLLQMVIFPSFSQANQFKLKTGQDTLAGAIAHAPELAWKILRSDVKALANVDRPLLALLVLALISMVIFWRRTESHLLLGSLLAYELYNVTNGTPTIFRYGMPGLAFVAVSVALLIAETQSAATRAGSPVEEDEPTAEADPGLDDLRRLAVTPINPAHLEPLEGVAAGDLGGTLDVSATLEDALALLMREDKALIGVTDGPRFLGVLTPNGIHAMLRAGVNDPTG